MNAFFARLKQRKLVQWSLAYIAAAFALIQVVDVVADSYGWPHVVMHFVFGVLVLGFVVALVLAWYHGERGAQRVSGPELLLIALALAIGGGLLWHFGRPGSSEGPAEMATAARAGVNPGSGPDAAKRNPGTITQDSAAGAAPSKLRSDAAAQVIPAKSIAVLPFENLSDDRKNGYFVAGMQDLILTKLADIGDLKVVSRSSTEKYASHPDDLGGIGQRLGVATFLEGSVQKAGRQVLINVQLIDAKTNDHIWAQSYTRTLDNIFGVEGDVAQKVADALNAKLTATETAVVAHVPTTNSQAYDDYLRGLHFDNEADKGDWAKYLPQAIAAYEKAVAEDPDFALAWAALSDARGNLFYWAGDRSQANLLAADTAARRALQLDPELPDAHLAMAGVERFLRHDLVAAHDQVQRAVELRPNDADALAGLAIADGNLGIAGAEKLIQRAIALDPVDPFNYFEAGSGLAADGDYTGARQMERRALAIDPQFALAYLALSQIEISRNLDVEAATGIIEHMAPGTPVNSMLVSWRIDLLLFQRQFDAARALAEEYAGKSANGPGAVEMAFARANIEWLAGKTNDARVLYRAAIGLAMKPGSEISGYDHALFGLAYARLGEAIPAKKQSDEALALAVESHKHDLPQSVKYMQAKIQLALGNKSAAIEKLTEVLSMDTRDIRAPWLLFLPRMQLDPTWDPIRHDPRFQALLKKYPQPTSSSTTVVAAVPSST